MQIWRICRAKFAGEAFSGLGALRFGGRWNSILHSRMLTTG